MSSVSRASTAAQLASRRARRARLRPRARSARPRGRARGASRRAASSRALRIALSNSGAGGLGRVLGLARDDAPQLLELAVLDVLDLGGDALARLVLLALDLLLQLLLAPAQPLGDLLQRPPPLGGVALELGGDRRRATSCTARSSSSRSLATRARCSSNALWKPLDSRRDPRLDSRRRAAAGAAPIRSSSLASLCCSAVEVGAPVGEPLLDRSLRLGQRARSASRVASRSRSATSRRRSSVMRRSSSASTESASERASARCLLRAPSPALGLVGDAPRRSGPGRARSPARAGASRARVRASARRATPRRRGSATTAATIATMVDRVQRLG